jgi:hypothetical protein
MATGVGIIKHTAEHTGYKNHHTRNTNGKIHQKKETRMRREMRHNTLPILLELYTIYH